MRLLHTSDWHLGARTGSLLRTADHDHFLDWLVGQLDAQEVDALLIAGDIFDTAQPSAEAMSQYYRFLQRVRRTGVQDVVVVGGNHDSASRLDAPRELLHDLNVHVVGGLPDDRGRMIVPLRRRSGEVGAVCLAVPYVHEYRLGLRTTDLDRRTLHQQLSQRFIALYREGVDAAMAAHPGVPVIATGHLAVGRVNPGDAPHEIHQIGGADVIHPDIFDRRLAYVALGHIHRAYAADKVGRVQFCGSPIPLSLPEMLQPRMVLRVDVDHRTRVDPLLVPQFRELLKLSGTVEEVARQLAGLAWTTPLPPAVHAEISDRGEGDVQRVHEALAAHPLGVRPELVDVVRKLADPRGADLAPPVTSLVELSADDVFLRRMAQKNISDERLLGLFRWLQGLSEEALAAHVAQIEGGGA